MSALSTKLRALPRKLRRSYGFLLLLGWVVILLLVHFILSQEEQRYSLVEEGLYIGGDAPKPPPGTTAVLNVCGAKDHYEVEHHSWKPIRDAAPAPSLGWLRERVAFVEEQREAGRTTFVHCQQGVSRSAMVVTAYLMKKNGWSRDRALEYLREKRPPVRPHAAFMELLLEWEAELVKSTKD